MNHHAKDSVLSSIQEKPWSQDKAFSYEAALISIGKVIGWYSAAIFDEQGKAAPDQDKINRLLADQRECVHDQRQLSADDPTQITEQAERYAAVLEELAANGRGR